jgi:1-deoxy-D-xylulose-5-phosphate synthase
LLHEVFSKYDKIVTVEDGTIVAGFARAVLECMNAHNYKAEIKILGIPDSIIEHGSPKELHHECGFDSASIADAVKLMIQASAPVLTAS